MLDSTEDKYSRLAKMAYLYHVGGKNQEEIATLMGVARPMISRQLKEAEKLGIVRIEVNYPIRSKKLEQEFIDRFNIKEPMIYIVETADPQELKMLIGRAAANYLENSVRLIKRLAISWGSTLFEMIQQLKPLQMNDLEVIQLSGATGREHNPNDGPIIARNLAERLGAKLYPLHAPLIVDSIQVAKALLKDKVIRQTLDRATEADLSLVGIGSLEPQKNSLYKAGYVNEEELKKMNFMLTKIILWYYNIIIFGGSIVCLIICLGGKRIVFRL